MQKNAAQFVCNNYNCCTSLSDLVSTMEIRRLAQQASMFYKIQNGLLGIPFPPVVIANPKHKGIILRALTKPGPDQIGLTKPGSDCIRLKKPGPDPKKIGSP